MSPTAMMANTDVLGTVVVRVANVGDVLLT